MKASCYIHVSRHVIQWCDGPNLFSLLVGDDNDKESSPFLSSETDPEHYYEDKNMALFEVRCLFMKGFYGCT